MSKHTPGPWEIIDKYRVHSALGADSGDGCPCDSSDGWLIADCSESIALVDGKICSLGENPLKANINLIAAAPDLLEALEYMLGCQYDYDERRQADCDMCAKARAAISKARGES
jgi:hypothetical protein